MAYDTGVPVPEPLPQDQQRQILSPHDKWTDTYALQIVRSDWAYAEMYRTQAHDWRYRNAQELYLGWAPQRYWDGTRVPRSSLGSYVIFQQIQSMMPKIVPTVTSYDNMHFYAENPGGDQTDDSVEAWKELVTRQLWETKFRMQVQRACQSILEYGNGVLEVGVEEYDNEYISFDKKQRPKAVRQMFHPAVGPIAVPTALEESFSRKITRETKLRPYIRYRSLVDIFVDPNCESPFMQDAQYVIDRAFLRAEKVKSYKDQSGFNIPDDDYLTHISMAKSTANADVTKLSGELFRYNWWNPNIDYTSDPSQKRIAVVRYTTPSRIVWWLQGGMDEQSIIYNQPNKYGMINYFSAPYAEVLDRWHALAVSDVAEGEQRLQQSIINARIDELALGIHPPTIKRRGVTLPWYQLKRRPGLVLEAENPKEDFHQQEVMNITQQAYVEVQASDVRVSKITGMNDLSAFGTGTPGGNSANRSATGVNVQSGATDVRMQALVATIEDMLIEPVINAVIQFDRKFLDMKSASNWLKLDPRFSKLDPVKVMNTRVVAECRGSIRMAARMGFLQAFPVLAQTYLNPELLQLLAQQQGMTVNVKELARRLDDAINYSGREPLLVAMTPQQKQAMQQPPAEALIKAQTQQQQLQSTERINDLRMRTHLIETLLKEFLRAHTQYAQMDDDHIHEIAQLVAAADQGEDSEEGGGGSNSGGAAANS